FVWVRTSVLVLFLLCRKRIQPPHLFGSCHGRKCEVGVWTLQHGAGGSELELVLVVGLLHSRTQAFPDNQQKQGRLFQSVHHDAKRLSASPIGVIWPAQCRFSSERTGESQLMWRS